MSSDRRSGWFTKEVIGPLLVAAILACFAFVRKSETAQLDVGNLKDVTVANAAELKEHDKTLQRHELSIAVIQQDMGYMKKGIDELLRSDRRRRNE